ncbi:IucA/IucC family protein [Streptomyces fructofermentans]|uniref:IucA/IucC family protein n=1 Tax=Streptomyces fructofermentans TaxID=152141 RepID=UPI0037969405
MDLSHSCPAAPPGGAAAASPPPPLLNCLLREVGEPVPPVAGGRRVYRLPPGGRLLRVQAGRRPSEPEVYAAGSWRRAGHDELVKLTAEVLRQHTGVSNSELPAEMTDSRDAVAAILTARAGAVPPGDPYLRSEQSLITGHPYHPAPKARGGGPVGGWLPYAPEAYARFPLVLLGVRADAVVEEGDTAALDALGTAPPGYRILPAHPWQLDLVGAGLAEAFEDGRLIRLGRTECEAAPTAAIRTLHLPRHPAGGDLFLKFSLDVRITNDVRRLWRHDLLGLRRSDAAAVAAFADLDAAWLSDRGYRTADFAFEELAVLVRDGLHGHVAPGATPLLAAALTECAVGGEGAAATVGADRGDGVPLLFPWTGPVDPPAWWEAYLRQVVPPALDAFARHGVVLEAHLQNTVIAVDADGTPVQALFRDAEGLKLLPDVSRAAGWERLVYCLVVNNLLEIAAVLGERCPEHALWESARREFSRCADGLPEVAGLLAAPTLPGKTNLLLRWTGADGAAARYLPVPNPLRARGADRA